MRLRPILFLSSICGLLSACGQAETQGLAPVATTGSYTDLTEQPDLSVFAQKAGLAKVAESGDYQDLKNAPDLSVYTQTAALSGVAFSGKYSELVDVPDLRQFAPVESLAPVASSGDYLDLINKPDFSPYTLRTEFAPAAFSGKYEDLWNTPDLSVYAPIAGLSRTAFTGSYADLTDKPDFTPFAVKASLASVATSGSYSDLSNTPDLSVYASKSSLAPLATSGAYDDLTGAPDLSVYARSDSLPAVAQSGNYQDLINKPNLSLLAEKSSLASVATSGSYSDLSNKPDLSVYAPKSSLSAVATSGSYSDLQNRPWQGDTTKISANANVTIAGNSTTVVDQQGTSGGGAYGPDTLFWQSFTAGMTGKLVAVDVNRWWNGPGSGFTLKIYAGEGTGGTVLHSQSNVSLPDGLSTIQLSTSVQLVSGQQYTWELTNSTAFMMIGYEWSTYAGGRGNGSDLPGMDFQFATRVVPDAVLSAGGMTVTRDGRVGIGTAMPTSDLDIAGDLRVRSSRTPAANDACQPGQITWSPDYVYVCVAANTWRRSALTAY